MQEFIENKELNKAEIKAEKVILESKPRMLMVVLTTRCNLECIMCSRAYPKRNLTLPFGTVKQIRSLFPYLETIDWQGGEAFLVDYFKQLFLEARDYQNIDQSVITNGLLIDEEWAEIFAESKVNLTYSIDAVSKKTYECIRKGAKFEDLLKSIDMINRANRRCNGRIQLHMNVVVMRSNYKELHVFPKFCKKYGFKHLRFDFLRPDVAPEEDILIQRDNAAVEYLKNELEEIEKESKELNIWFEYTFKPFLLNKKADSNCSKIDTDEAFEHLNYSQPVLKCKLPWKKLFIDAAGGGNVRPDCLCEHSVGNIMNTTLDEIWNNEIMQLYRRNLINGCVQNWCSKICLDNAVDTYQLEGCR